MTYDQLVAFLAVAHTGTFAAASRQLHKSQPAVSKLVSNLEDELKLGLLDRTAYRPVLTEAGRQLLPRIEQAVAEADDVRDFARELAAPDEAVVRLVIDAVTPLDMITPALNSVQSTYPHARIQLRTETLASTLDCLFEGAADLVVGQTQGADLSNMEVVPFLQVPVSPVARADHPLAKQAGTLTRRDIRQHVQVVLREQVRRSGSYSINVVRGARQWSVSDLQSKRSVILAGLGWGGLPTDMVAQELRDGILVALDLPEFRVRTLSLALIRPAREAGSAAAQSLFEALASGRR